jgi:TRAP transporter TAXI family solute receptor|tara:strand:- start:3013 stop:3978 length:966 start_codon:yes stop_codon:yes gene_type:complete
MFRKKIWRARTHCVAAVLVLTAAGLAAQAQESITIGSVPATSSHFPYAVAMAAAIRKELPNRNISLIETGASVDNHKRLGRGEIEIALTTSSVAIQATNGLGKFEGKAQNDLLVLYVCDFSVMNMAVRVDSGVTRIEDLKGKRFSPGIRGSGAELLTNNAFELFDIGAELVPGTLTEAVEGIQNRDLVGYAKYGLGTNIDATLREIMVSTEMRIIGLDEEQQEKLMQKVPGLTMYDLPEGLIPNQPAVTSPGIAVIYLTRKGMLDDDTAYAIAKAMGERHGEISEAMPHTKNYDYRAMTLAIENVGLKIHPGAERYWTKSE